MGSSQRVRNGLLVHNRLHGVHWLQVSVVAALPWLPLRVDLRHWYRSRVVSSSVRWSLRLRGPLLLLL